MSIRPLSERHHDLTVLETVHEVQVWDDAAWRTVCCCGRLEDAEVIAAALVSAEPPAAEFVEIWAAPAADRAMRVVGRFPRPTHEEAQDLWRRAVDANYATAYVDLRH